MGSQCPFICPLMGPLVDPLMCPLLGLLMDSLLNGFINVSINGFLNGLINGPRVRARVHGFGNSRKIALVYTFRARARLMRYPRLRRGEIRLVRSWVLGACTQLVDYEPKYQNLLSPL